MKKKDSDLFLIFGLLEKEVGRQFFILVTSKVGLDCCFSVEAKTT